MKLLSIHYIKKCKVTCLLNKVFGPLVKLWVSLCHKYQRFDLLPYRKATQGSNSGNRNSGYFSQQTTSLHNTSEY